MSRMCYLAMFLRYKHLIDFMMSTDSDENWKLPIVGVIEIQHLQYCYS